jgi:hypothetical protein
MAAVDAELPDADDRRLSDLLDRQQAGALSPSEQSELTGLMERYQQGLLRRAFGTREAIRRGLRQPLDR